MAEHNLRQELARFFDQALWACRRQAQLDELADLVESQRRAVDLPMRVAFVGRTNSGKSTMMNAFLGSELAATGNRELTFNVNWFRYGEKRQLIVHKVDETEEPEPFENLADLTARCESKRGLLECIRYIEVRLPNPLLRVFDLIDTPGLHSFYEKDSRNTIQLLTDDATRPHAIVFLFSSALQEADIRELDHFHERCGSLMTGLTAIGALTKVDEMTNGMADGWRVVHQIESQHARARRSFYTMMPVIGQAAFGFQTLTSDELETLLSLAVVPEPLRSRMLRTVEGFETREYPDQPSVPPPSARQKLSQRLSRYGIRTAFEWLDQGRTPDTLRDLALESCNLKTLRATVISHFGNRAFLIKAKSALNSIRERAFQCGEQSEGTTRKSAWSIVSDIDSIALNEPRFREFALLERYYQGNLALESDDLQQLLAITGENGACCAARLGVGVNTPAPQLLQIAEERIEYWRTKTYQPFASLELREMARVLAESYAALRARVADATDHLAAAAELLEYQL